MCYFNYFLNHRDQASSSHQESTGGGRSTFETPKERLALTLPPKHFFLEIHNVRSTSWLLTLSKPGEGRVQIVPPPPPPRYTSSNISRTPWAMDLKLSVKLKELIIIFNTTYIFNRVHQPWVAIVTSKIDACFPKTHFGSVHAKAYQDSKFFAIFMKSGLYVVSCGNLGLILRLMASWW